MEIKIRGDIVFKLKKYLWGVVPAIVMLILLGLISGCGGGTTDTGKPAESQDTATVKDMVNKYLTAIQQKDFETLITMSGIVLEKEQKDGLIDNLKQTLSVAMDIDIKSFEIKETRVEGSIAFVDVEENCRIAPKGVSPEEGWNSDYRTITETIVLIKRDNKWKIDGVNTLHLSQFIHKHEKEMIKGMNKLGVARLMAVLMDPELNCFVPIFASNFIQARGAGQFTACKSNMKNIGTALEMYSTDNNGRYPDSLSKLSPDYLRMLPTCPSANRDTYSESYKSSANPDTYAFCCLGHNHPNETGPDFPQYNSTEGLVYTPNKSDNDQSSASMNPQEKCIACQSNLKNLATALEMYSTDNRGRYPDSLSKVAPDYLKVIPTCPAAGKDTYSESYQVSATPDAYTFYCIGNNHPNVSSPQVSEYITFSQEKDR